MSVPFMRISGTWMHICVKMSPRHNFEKWRGGLSKRICRPQFSQKVNHAVGRESSECEHVLFICISMGESCAVYLHVWKVAPRFGDYV